MGEDGQIRTATMDDIVGLMTLTEEVQALHVEEEPGFFAPFHPAELRAWWESELARPDLFVLLALSGGEPVGCLTLAIVDRPRTLFGPGRRMGAIDMIVVTSRFRRQGVGRALIAAARVRAEAAGCTELAAEHYAFNTASGALLEAAGFRVLRIRRVAELVQPDSLRSNP